MQVEKSTVKDTGESYTCNTCGLSFPTADLQRLHMRTDWHRYNLKRRVAQLPPISSEMFAEKMLQQERLQQMEQEKAGRGSNRRSSGQRQATKKDKRKEERLMKKMAEMNLREEQRQRQSSGTAATEDSPDLDQEQYEEGDKIERPSSPSSMVSSTFSLGEPVDEDDDNRTDDLHSVGMASVAEDSEAGDDEDEKEIRRRLARAVKIPPTVCFVDGKQFGTVEENVAYMEKKYGLFIPEREYLVDLEGLISYLGEKIGLGNLCLSCGFQGRSLESVRQHLISKQHVKIPYENMDEKLEISDYYDFRSSYKASKAKSKSRASKTTVIHEGDGADDDEWEDDSDVEEVSDFEDEDDEEIDDEDEDVFVDDSGYELMLPSGHRAGHRSLARYYSQNLRPSTITREGQGTVVAVDTKQMLRVRDPVEVKQQKQAWATQKKKQNVEMRRGKFQNFQKHFRDELLQ